ncbi:MAG: hypothetical protein ACJ8GJ_14180 [Vitreoscilla sp.]
MNPDRRPMMKTASLALALASLSCAAAEPVALPDRTTAAVAVARYLAEHGDFCLGKMDWPVDISALDERARGRDVVQMPVLESLGLVRSSVATALRVEGADVEEGGPARPVAVRRYELTPLGQQFVRDREVVMASAGGDKIVRRRDLCAAHLSLQQVVAVEPGDAPRSFVASFTYEAVPVAWAVAPEFQRVFPMAARVIGGAGRLQLKQAFAWSGDGWRPVAFDH